MDVLFTQDAWDDYRHWAATDATTLTRLNALIADATRHPFTGLGKPEPLKGALSGWWSRRLAGEHRLVYRVTGRKGVDQRIEIAQCRYHY